MLLLVFSFHLQRRPNPQDNFVFNSPVSYLWKRDAIKARRIILGLIAAKSEKLDLSKIPRDEVAFKLEEIGKSREFPMV